MFKENRQFWLYIVGAIAAFLVLFYALAKYTGRDNLLPSTSTDPATDAIVVAPTSAPTAVSFTSVPENSINTEYDYFARIQTNFGELTLDLYEKSAPNTVNNFTFLATKDFYDGTSFHRLVPNILLQGGSRNTLNSDPADDKYGGPGYVIKDEINWDSLDFSPELRAELTSLGYKPVPAVASKDVAKYRLAMAGTGPDTAGSQFFIILGDGEGPIIQSLRGKHTVFAEVIDGQEIVDKLNEISVDDPKSNSPRPLQDIVIEDIEIFTK